LQQQQTIFATTAISDPFHNNPKFSNFLSYYLIPRTKSINGSLKTQITDPFINSPKKISSKTSKERQFSTSITMVL